MEAIQFNPSALTADDESLHHAVLAASKEHDGARENQKKAHKSDVSDQALVKNAHQAVPNETQDQPQDPSNPDGSTSGSGSSTDGKGSSNSTDDSGSTTGTSSSDESCLEWVAKDASASQVSYVFICSVVMLAIGMAPLVDNLSNIELLFNAYMKVTNDLGSVMSWITDAEPYAGSKGLDSSYWDSGSATMKELEDACSALFRYLKRKLGKLCENLRWCHICSDH